MASFFLHQLYRIDLRGAYSQQRVVDDRFILSYTLIQLRFTDQVIDYLDESLLVFLHLFYRSF